MHLGHKVVVVTPAGRQRYLALLLPHLHAYHAAGVLDEYHLWVNTEQPEDIEYMLQLEREHDWIHVKRLPEGVRVAGNQTISHFWKLCLEDAVYVRFDDDIVALDDVGAFKRLLEFRIQNPQYFLVSAVVLNNAIATHLLQRFGDLDLAAGIAGYECMDPTAWGDPQFAAHLHAQVLAELKRSHGSLAKFRFHGKWDFYYHERFSINCVSWLGPALARDCGGDVGDDEEHVVTTVLPGRVGKLNTIYGGFCAVHFAFYTQREHLDSLGVLEQYARHVPKVRKAART